MLPDGLLTLRRPPYTLSTDPGRLDLPLICRYLAEESYWAAGRPHDVIRRSLENSLNFGLYHGEAEQVGFARLVTDMATFAWLADVFILPGHRGRGLSKWMLEAIIGHPELQTMRRIMLGTRDAHGLYEQFGFRRVGSSELYMERRKDIPNS